MKKENRVVTIIKVGILVILILITATTYNRVITLRSHVEEQYAQIENVLQARLEKIPDLMRITASYASYEETVYQNINLQYVTNARTNLKLALESGDVLQVAEANDNLTEALQELVVIVEGYPELTSSKLYIGLMDEIAESANRVSQERRKYNQAVSEYNNYLDTFPASIFTGMFNFNYAKYFSASPEAHTTSFFDNK